MAPAQLEADMQELKRENYDMKQYVLALQGEVYGARLAAKYLDKELAGRCVILYVLHLMYSIPSSIEYLSLVKLVVHSAFIVWCLHHHRLCYILVCMIALICMSNSVEVVPVK